MTEIPNFIPKSTYFKVFYRLKIRNSYTVLSIHMV